MATFTVTTELDVVDDGDGVLSLREAIALANDNDGLDVIVFALGAGAATLDLDDDTAFSITDELTIDGDGDITIDANSDSRIFDIASGAPVTIRGMTLEEGSVDGSAGGAIRSLSDLVLEDVTIRDSETRGNSDQGGAVWAEGTLTVRDSTFDGNRTLGDDAAGGALFSRGDMVIENSSFSGNETSGEDSEGGAVATSGTLTISDSSFTANQTSGDGSGGGAAFAEEALSLSGGDFENNVTLGADARGGAIWVDDEASIDGTSFTGNGTGGGGGTSGQNASGGAISAEGDVTVANAAFDANSTLGASAAGGAIFSDGDVTVTGSDFTTNSTAGDNSGGGAIRGASIDADGTGFADNATAGAQSGGGALSSAGAVTIAGGTLTGNSTAGTGSLGGAVSGFDVAISNLAAAATDNMTAGASAGGGVAAAAGTLTVANADFEMNATSGASAGGGAFYSNGAMDLSFVVLRDNTTAGDAASGGAVLSQGALTIADSSLTGNATAGADALGGAITGLGAVTVDRSFVDANATTGDRASGGGIHASGPLVLRDTTVSNNATDGLSAAGGGISADALATLLNATVNGNMTGGTGSPGGGIFGGGETVLANVTLASNTTVGVDSAGGGIFAAGALTAVNVTVTGNLTTGEASPGGGVFADTARAIGDSILIGNVATSRPTFEGDLADGADVEVTSFGNNITGGGATTAEDVFAETFTLASGVLAGRLADNGGRVGTVALLEQGANPALDASTPGNQAEGVVGADLNGDGDLFDVIETDARGPGFPRQIDILGVASGPAGNADLGAYEAPDANRAPVALDDGLTIDEGEDAASVNLLGNDSDLDEGTMLSITSLDVPEDFQGRADLDMASGVLTYDPQGLFATLSASERVMQTLTYTLEDGEGGSDVGTVTITVQGVNANPTAVDDSFELGALSPETGIPVTGNDADPDRLDTISIASLDLGGTFGMARISEDGLSILYDPAGAFDDVSPGGVAVDTLDYTLTDGNGGTATATLEVRVRGETDVNASPVAADDTLLTVSGAVARIAPLADNGNGADSDPDGDMLSIESVGTPEGGILLDLGDGTFLYRADRGFEGTDSFEYVISDGRGATATGEIAVSVAAPAAETSLSPGAAQRVAYTYEAALDRDGDIDVDGLNFWIRARFEGIGDQEPLSEDALAQAFLISDEFREAFGDPTTLGDRELVEVLFRNVLERDGEEAGVNFWEAALAQEDFGRTDLLIAFAASPENLLGSPQITTLSEVEPGVWDFVA